MKNMPQTATYIGNTTGWEDRVGQKCFIIEMTDDVDRVQVRFQKETSDVYCKLSSLAVDEPRAVETAIYIDKTSSLKEHYGKKCDVVRLLADRNGSQLALIHFHGEHFDTVVPIDSLNFDENPVIAPSDNNIEVAMCLSTIMLLLEDHRIPESMMSRIQSIVSAANARMDSTGDVSAEHLVEYFENKFKK